MVAGPKPSLHLVADVLPHTVVPASLTYPIEELPTDPLAMERTLRAPSVPVASDEERPKLANDLMKAREDNIIDTRRATRRASNNSRIEVPKLIPVACLAGAWTLATKV